MKQYVSLLIAGAFVLLPAQAVLAQGSRPEAPARPDTSAIREQAQARAEESRQQAEERVETIKQEVEERRATIKQEVCERRQQQLQSVMPRLATGATSVKSSLDTVYSRVQSFYDNGQLTVSNYDELNANVAAAQADAEVVLSSISSYEFELDCENPNVGEQLDGFRSAVTASKESLQTYRDQLVELISAMRAAAADQAEANSDETANDETNANVDQGEAPVTEGAGNDQE